MTIKLARRAALVALSLLVASPGRAQTTTQNQITPDPVETVSLEPAVLEIAPITGTLKEMCRKDNSSSGSGKKIRRIVDFRLPICPSRSCATRLRAE